MPAQQEKRRKVAAKKSPRFPNFSRPHVVNSEEKAITQDTGYFLSSASAASHSFSSSESLQSGDLINTSLAHKLSQEYFTSLKGQVSHEKSTKQVGIYKQFKLGLN